MWEYTNPEQPANESESTPEQEAPKPTYEELETQLANAVLDKESAERNIEYYKNGNQNYRSMIAQVESYLDDNWNDDTDSDTAEHFTEIAERLGITTSVSKTVTLTVSIDVEVSVPRSYDLDSLSEYDWDIDVSCNESDVEVDSVDVNIERVDYN